MNNAQILDAQKSFDQKLGTFIWPYSYGLTDSQKTHELLDKSFARMAELGLNYCVLGMTYANLSRDGLNNYHASTEPINQYAIESALRNDVIPIVSYGMWAMTDFDQDIFNHDQQTFLNAIAEIHCRLIRRYKGRQVLWEGLNEPDNGATPWFDNEGAIDPTRVRQIVQLNTRMAKQVKQDPAMMYFGGNLFTYPAASSDGVDYWQPYFDDGMLVDSDAFANHPYGNKYYWQGKPEFVFDKWNPATYAPIKGMPYVSTEYGYTRDEFDDTTVANYITRQSVLLDAMGYSLFTVYGFDMSGASPWSMVNADGSYNQTSTQLLNLRDKLTGYHFDHWISDKIGGLWAARYLGPNSDEKVVYWVQDSELDATITFLNGQSLSVHATNTAKITASQPVQDVLDGDFLAKTRANVIGTQETLASMQRLIMSRMNDSNVPVPDTIKIRPNGDRGTYRWLVTLPQQIESNVNAMIDWFNTKQLPWYHMPENQPMQHIQLRAVHSLWLGNRVKQIWSQNWLIVHDTLHQMQDILKQRKLVD
ncbi:hypothetical protein [Furfurilactobacillus rossiae]|uniref:Glycoside hydrolase family 5 domain-containing protein n=1 Tax=Furfurilactobacillus rossiae DSM 15814 TaxID=1114972 RepID=A0A0R1RIF4_9LACO|nr:hypothetical protein [Furfurilactobacillus rossiae]KRL56685.1 hypothetical protein FD35_GL001784 [Furfurilactobacillus rossiae DSM 15814]QFR66414.1 hypothetical protein LR814_04605 [Furfurilactobacillus rossiae]QLE61870.1 hypothetical protein LROSRS0_1825 [Furfurilactobacillus rossiae]